MDTEKINLFTKLSDIDKNLIQSELINDFINQFYDKRIIDALLYLPFAYSLRYEDTKIKIENLDNKINIAIKLKIEKIIQKNKFSKIKLIIQTKSIEDVKINLYFININPHFIAKLKTMKEAVFSGYLEKFDNKLTMFHPKILARNKNITNINFFETIHFRENKRIDFINQINDIVPIYKANKNLTNENIKQTMNFLLNIIKNDEILYFDEILKKYPKLIDSIKKIHNPSSISDINHTSIYIKKIALDEILNNNLSLKLARLQSCKNFSLKIDNFNNLKIDNFITKLQFELTKSQLKCFEEIKTEILSNKRMIRLLQGDVGSGKTIIAALSSLLILNSNLKSCVISPTMILAYQHFNNFKKLFPSYNISILTGKETQKQKENIKQMLRLGMVDILISTHSVFYIDFELRNFGLIVIDEQHSFGVAQRNSIIEKNPNSHILMMSATPIPRTMLMSMYNDISLSIINEKPQNRKPIITKVLSEDKTNLVLDSLLRIIEKKEKIYWICPLISKNEDNVNNLMDVESRFEEIKNKFPNINIKSIHGKLKNYEKEEAMIDFKEKNIDLLIATTVIEVGIDVPNATLIVIENADNFGMAQLHQLRGRVGRSDLQSYCILIYSNRISENGIKRLEFLRENDDGLKIAEKDLEFRGSGNILNYEQSGFKIFNIASFTEDKELFQESNQMIKMIFHNKDFYLKDIDILLKIFNSHQKLNLINS